MTVRMMNCHGGLTDQWTNRQRYRGRGANCDTLECLDLVVDNTMLESSMLFIVHL